MAKRPPKDSRMIDGVFLLDKPLGDSSNRVLQQVKRLFKAQKAGHTGALDPLASGVLPICLGESTKYSQFLLDSDKAYLTTAKLGQRTASCDAESEVTEEKPVPEISIEQVNELLKAHLTGKITQVPPIYSALKVNGVPLYKLARQGIEVEVKSREVTIHSIKLMALREDEIDLEIKCSKGTYIRSIVDELGQLLGCGAHVSYLRRTAHGDYHIDNAYTMEQLIELSEKEDLTQLDQWLLPADSPVETLPKVELTPEEVDIIVHGQFVQISGDFGFYRLYDQSTNEFLGLGEKTEKHGLKPHRIRKRLVETTN